MKIRNLALVLGATFTVAVGGFAVTACSSSTSNNTGIPSGTKDSGTNNNDSGNTGNNDSGSSSDDGGGTTTMDAGCKSAPTLHVEDAGTIFCGYGAADGGKLECYTNQQCCLGGKDPSQPSGFAPEMCATWGGGCDNPAPDGGTPIECNQNADCTANGKSGSVCCLQGASAPAMPTGCTYYQSKGGSAISCETGSACASGDIQICSSDSDCPTGKTCTPMKWKLYQLGFCQ